MTSLLFNASTDLCNHAFIIHLQPRNDEAPTIVADTLFVEEGSVAAILNSSVYVSDIDTEFDGQPSNEVHTLSVVSLPREGILQWRNGTELKVGSQFGVNVSYHSTPIIHIAIHINPLKYLYFYRISLAI